MKIGFDSAVYLVQRVFRADPSGREYLIRSGDAVGVDSQASNSNWHEERVLCEYIG